MNAWDYGREWPRPTSIELNPHVPGLVRRLEESETSVFVVSTGFRSVARRMQEQLEWQSVRVYANDLVEGPDVRVNVSADARSPVSKKRLAESFAARGELDPDRTLVVSDSTADLAMMAACRYQVLVSGDDDLEAVHGMLGGC